MDKMLIGNMGRAQGIKGEIRFNLASDNPDKYNKLKRLYIGGVSYDIEQLMVRPNGVFVKLKGVDDRNIAELFVGKTVEIDKKDATKPPTDSYYIIDLVGCELVLDSGDKIGKLSEILQHGAADVYVVKGDKNCMFPALKDCIISTDIDAKIITLRAARFKEIVVYED